MEATLSSAENVPLIGELSLSLAANPRAPYVASRAQVTSYCQQNIIAHNSSNVLQFSLADSIAWLDPKSVVIAFDIVNTSAVGPLEFLSTDMQTLFSRLQVTMGGTIVEDQSHYNRLCCLFNKYQSQSKILETSAMALGTPHEMNVLPGTGDAEVEPQLWSVDHIKPERIPLNEKRRVCMRLSMSSIFAGSDRWIPLWGVNGGIKIALTLDAPENVVKVNAADGQPIQSARFQLSAAVCLWDAVTLDTGAQNKYLEQLAREAR